MLRLRGRSFSQRRQIDQPINHPPSAQLLPSILLNPRTLHLPSSRSAITHSPKGNSYIQPSEAALYKDKKQDKMSQPSSAHLRSIYRSILRELPPRPILRSPRSHLHNHLRTSFTDQTAAGTHAQAEQLIRYLRSQRLYVSLIERYNPGMDMDEEERVRLTARRVGMDLPNVPYRNRSGELK